MKKFIAVIGYMFRLLVFPIVAFLESFDSRTDARDDLWFTIICGVMLPMLTVAVLESVFSSLSHLFVYGIAFGVYLFFGIVTDLSFRKFWGGTSRRGYL